VATSKEELFETEPVMPIQDDSELKPNRGVKPEEVILKSSQIDRHDDSGGDPYNSTGQHVVLELNRAERTNQNK
jgi:hypothetical protein